MLLSTDQGQRTINPDHVACVYPSPLRERIIDAVIVLDSGTEIAVTAPRPLLRWLEARSRYR
jgi:hypothetical protein